MGKVKATGVTNDSCGEQLDELWSHIRLLVSNIMHGGTGQVIAIEGEDGHARIQVQTKLNGDSLGGWYTKVAFKRIDNFYAFLRLTVGAMDDNYEGELSLDVRESKNKTTMTFKKNGAKIK